MLTFIFVVTMVSALFLARYYALKENEKKDKK